MLLKINSNTNLNNKKNSPVFNGNIRISKQSNTGNFKFSSVCKTLSMELKKAGVNLLSENNYSNRNKDYFSMNFERKFNKTARKIFNTAKNLNKKSHYNFDFSIWQKNQW